MAKLTSVPPRPSPACHAAALCVESEPITDLRTAKSPEYAVANAIPPRENQQPYFLLKVSSSDGRRRQCSRLAGLVIHHDDEVSSPIHAIFSKASAAAVPVAS